MLNSKKTLKNTILFICSLFFIFFSSCVSTAATAEEYFSIGMAFFELGRYDEAERWLQRATAADRTVTASEYNLGRIAFETGRFNEAARYFELVIAKDPDNVMALRAAAYTRIRLGELDKAEDLYNRVLALIPENADDGYNYALVLFALEKYEESEEVLLNYPFALDSRPDSLLLLARAQDAADKVEAIDTYAKWIADSSDNNPQVLREFAKALEKAELYARALEQYRASLEAIREGQDTLTRSTLYFDIGRLLLIADSGNPEGLIELDTAIAEGFNDKDALEALLLEDSIDDNTKNEIRRLIERIDDPTPDESIEEDPEDDDDDSENGVLF